MRANCCGKVLDRDFEAKAGPWGDRVSRREMRDRLLANRISR
ncbi:hypothetical protein QT972_28490 [Microcoleus sp. herbarium7]